MAPMHMRLNAALAAAVLSTSVVTAQQAALTGTVAVKARQTLGAAAQKSGRQVKTLIIGVAMDARQLRMPNAAVRLRNLETNDIEQVVTANQLGEFTFIAQPNIPYVVEVADLAGRIVAVGDVIVANAGDVAGAVVTVPGRLPALAGLFGDTASSVISAATGTGLTVVDPAQPKVSPTR
jgi:hypothetical protein